MTFIKICGITSIDDALLAIDAGADALGLNFVPSSRRVVDRVTAAHIAEAVGDRVELIAVVADRPLFELEDLREATGIRWLQLHGAESVSDLELVLPKAFKAVPIGNAEDALRAGEFGGSRVLVDAKSSAALGGTGQRFDWSLVVPLARRRHLIVAGGLTPANVAEAVGAIRPYGVDVASGVEAAGNPRKKDETKLRAFVAAVRAATEGS
jgi:phosphoribosylanthranilate isomerase